MKYVNRLTILGLISIISIVCCISSLAQDSLRYENMSCISSVNPNDIQDGLTFTIKLAAKKKTKYVEVTIENYPGETEPMNLVFGRTTDLGSGNVLWRDNGAFMLSRVAKGKQWILYFGAIQEGRVSVPCQIIKKTSLGDDLLMYQLVFTSTQIEQIKSFLKQSVEDNIIKQIEL